ncbi:hypothetical protein LXA43DRAFT_880859, partial [Ganoderma leucocontextum]
MLAFVKSILKWDPAAALPESGLLGLVKAYYGCVEAQGRGTLHCHMLLWIEGSLNPCRLQQCLRSPSGAEFGRRLLAYLERTIHTSLPTLPPGVPVPEGSCKHSLTTRGVPLDVEGEERDKLRALDSYNLVSACQRHEHTDTCYKYCDKSDPRKTCRFELDIDNVIPTSSIDMQTGTITLQHLDGLVNNYNPTVLEAMHCNMDIKFIGSGEDAKALIYYITDYVTKSPLKAHVSYAALEQALKNFHASNQGEESKADVAKRLLRKCAFSLTSNQELSAPQVAAFLLGYDDFYTSDDYANLYWTSFERLLERQLPNPDDPDLEDVPDATADDDDADESDEGNEDDVPIGPSEDGDLRILSTQVNDYVYRGDELRNVSLWDFVAQTEKIVSS